MARKRVKSIDNWTLAVKTGHQKIYLCSEIKVTCVKIRINWGKIESSSWILEIEYIADWYSFERKRKG